MKHAIASIAFLSFLLVCLAESASAKCAMGGVTVAGRITGAHTGDSVQLKLDFGEGDVVWSAKKPVDTDGNFEVARDYSTFKTRDVFQGDICTRVPKRVVVMLLDLNGGVVQKVELSLPRDFQPDQYSVTFRNKREVVIQRR